MLCAADGRYRVRDILEVRWIHQAPLLTKLAWRSS
jgi:hypothetical protein